MVGEYYSHEPLATVSPPKGARPWATPGAGSNVSGPELDVAHAPLWGDTVTRGSCGPMAPPYLQFGRPQGSSSNFTSKFTGNLLVVDC